MYKKVLCLLLITCFVIGSFGVASRDVYADAGIVPNIEVLPGLAVEVGEEVFFSAEASTYNGQKIAQSSSADLVRYEWDFGDGYNMRPLPFQDGDMNNGYGGLAAIHYFMTPGTFDVTLKITRFATSNDALNRGTNIPLEVKETVVQVTVTGETPIDGFEVLRAPFNARIAQFITVVIPEEIASSGTNKLVVTLEGKDPVSIKTLVNKTIEGTEEKYLLDHSELVANEYRLVTKLLDASNEQISIWIDKFTKAYDDIPKVGINEWNAICKDGEPYFPVTMYWLYQDQMDLFRDCGGAVYSMNDKAETMTVQRWVDYVNKTKSYGWDITGPGLTPGVLKRNTSLEARKSYVEATKNDEAMLMWDWHDEPNINASQSSYFQTVSPVLAAWTYATRQIDSTHPVTINMYGYDYLPWYDSNGKGTKWITYRDSAEIFGGKRAFFVDVMQMDVYPLEARLHASMFYNGTSNYIKDGPIAQWVQALDNFIERDFDLVPHGFFVQTCDGHNTGDDANTPAPTHEQVLMQAWLTVTHGGKMLNWFPYHVPATRQYNAMKEFAKSMETYGKIIVGPDNVEQITDNSNGRTNRVDTLTRKGVEEGDNDTYLFAVRLTEPEPLNTQKYVETEHMKPENIEREVITTTFTVPGVTEGYAYVMDINGNAVDFIPIRGGKFTDTYRKEDYRIYRIKADDMPVNLVSIPTPAAKEVVAKRNEKSADALRLPGKVSVTTNLGPVNVDVIWDVESSEFDPESKIQQTVAIDGEVILPAYVENTNNVGLDVSIEVTVNPKNIWTASAGFSSTQGENQWYYYWSLTGGGSRVDMQWDAVNNRWKDKGTVIWISDDEQYVQDSRRYGARAWKAPKAGTISIESRVGFAPGAAESNSADVKVKKNNTLIWENTIDTQASVDYNQTDIAVSAGDLIYFEVTRESTGTNTASVIWDPTITMPEQNQPPVLGNIRDRKAYVGTELSFTISAEDPNDDVLTYAVKGQLPDGASFDADTCEFTWTPQESQAGTHNVTFTVTDGKIYEPLEKMINIYVDIPVVNVDITGEDVTGEAGNKALTLVINGTVMLTAEVDPEDASDKTVSWSSSWPAIATVSGNGTVKTLREGTVVITAKSVSNAGREEIKAQCTVTVIKVSLTEIAVTTPPAKTIYGLNEPLDLTGLVVTGTYENGSEKALNITMDNISGFDSSELKIGQIVTVTCEGKTATFTVNITGAEEPAVVLKGPGRVQAGSSFAVALGLQNNLDNVNAVTIKLDYDDDQFEFISLEPANASIMIPVYSTSPGSISLTVASMSEIKGADIPLVSLNFKAREIEDLQTASISVTDAILGISSDASDYDALGSSITILVSSRIPGDLNGDGLIRTGDLAKAVTFFGAQEGDDNWNAAKAADVNDDGFVDIVDLVYIARRILNIQ